MDKWLILTAQIAVNCSARLVLVITAVVGRQSRRTPDHASPAHAATLPRRHCLGILCNKLVPKRSAQRRCRVSGELGLAAQRRQRRTSACPDRG